MVEDVVVVVEVVLDTVVLVVVEVVVGLHLLFEQPAEHVWYAPFTLLSPVHQHSYAVVGPLHPS